MKLSAISACTNNMSKNAGQKVSFGMFGTETDARIAREGGMPRHRTEITPIMAKKLKPYTDMVFKNVEGKDGYESAPGKPITTLEMLEKTPHFLFYLRQDDLVGIAPIEATFLRESPRVKNELKSKQESKNPMVIRIPDVDGRGEDDEYEWSGKTILNNLLGWIFQLEYKNNFPKPPYYNLPAQAGVELSEIDAILERDRAAASQIG